MGFDIEAARKTYQQKIASWNEARHRRWLEATKEAARIIDYIAVNYRPRRIIQWGSLLRPDRFTENSDIDIAVEGISSPGTWSRMEREVEGITTMPLDLVPFDRIHREHQNQILSRGKVVYERPD
jgi:predicted nucleotidyltransferase